ncbi:hypothetical protein GN958_ATG16677 [Phytophthora infestans]|uniref:Uncharacterized protein n=1 Tax=Phytophthora infestans TaxID=4787 RepID=A0A8S9TL76_PHYIN|nr:hypothetical protein GN958_ATG21676 [Phytophthora infestans]KAF4134136.1 hypothetical protein GN958_ATG16677 [Phytophthora infestans]
MWQRDVSKIGVSTNAQYDADMNALTNTVSDHAVQLVKHQYDFALLPTTKYRYYSMGPYIMMQYTAATEEGIQEEYMMNPQVLTCSGIFRVTRLLPCRHIIYYRKATGSCALVPESILHPRWVFKNYKKLKKEKCEPVGLPYEDRKMPLELGGRAKPQNEKFNELLHSETVSEHTNIFPATLRDSLHQDTDLQQLEEKEVVCVDPNEHAEFQRVEERDIESQSAA